MGDIRGCHLVEYSMTGRIGNINPILLGSDLVGNPFVDSMPIL